MWISGPPGSGKTSLITSYLDARKLPCLWYRIDEGDADIASFFYYMGLAAKKAAPSKRKPLPLLTPEYSKGIPVFTRCYFEELYSRLRPPFIIVFDNYQDASIDSGFHEIVNDALDVIPDGINVFISSRNLPPPQLARLRANNKINLLGWTEIKFTVEEAGKILRTDGKRSLNDKALLDLHKKTDGWAAGLVLIGLSSRSRAIEYRSMKRFPTREVFEYFATEIFKGLERVTQEFLLKTAFLATMTTQMAEKLTGFSTAGRTLSQLSENHYFIERYSEDNPVYEYHPLFREFLLSRAKESLTGEEVSSIQRQAAQLLEVSGQIGSAAELYRDAKDWERLIQLILTHSPALVSQGRNQTLQGWIESIPGQVRENTPWLLYWLGVSREPFSLSESRLLFERALHLFEDRKDKAGSLLSWSGIVDAVLFEYDDFKRLDSWIEWLEKRMQHDPSFPSPEIEARVASSMTGALLYRRPYHLDIKKWMERALSLSREIGDLALQMKAHLNAVSYYAWMGDLSNSNVLADEIRRTAQLPTSPPLMVLTWKWIEALIYDRTIDSSELSLKSVSDGLGIAQRNGVHVWDYMLLAQGVYASFNKEDLAMADEVLKRMETTLEKKKRHHLCQFYYLTAWYHLLADNVPRASFYAESALGLSDETGMYFTKILCSLLMAEVLYKKEEYKKGASQLSSTKELVRRSGSAMLEYMCRIKEAGFALDRRNWEEQGLKALRSAMQLGKEHGYAGLFPWWQQSIMARLCARALLEGIDVNYVQDLVRKHHLILEEPPLYLENWPWPLKIYTLGKFEILQDDKLLVFSRKVQKKPLLMLKALIAQGGKDVREEQLSDVLWPEADGDQAHSAFTTTLSRLRQLIGHEKAIKHHEGKTALDRHYCWVDSWIFERIFDEIEARSKSLTGDGALGRDADEEVLELIQKAMKMYQGPFLANESEDFWTTSYRERLRAKLIRLITRLGDYLQQTGQWEKAVDHYQRGLNVDELAEEFYQNLMTCYCQLGELVKAAQLYYRCRKVLFAGLGIEPSPKTQSIYQEIVKNVRIKSPNRA